MEKARPGPNEESKHVRTLRIAAAAVVATAGLILSPAAAQATELPTPEVAWLHDNVIVTGANGAEASVLAKYRCYGGETGTHLWVSVKQGGTNLEGEHSSARAKSWYDTNYQYAEDPAGQTIDCDGNWHTTRFTVKLVDGWQKLDDGPAWVQFCVFDSTGGFGYSYGWKTVKVPA
jgi:hypothetical protein